MANVNLDGVRVLLRNGAEVLGSGYEGMAVLMKPFLNSAVLSHESDDDDEDDNDDWSAVDRLTCICLDLVIDSIPVLKESAFECSQPRWWWDEADWDEAEPAAKKRRM
jgi:hypothetical protein